MADDRVVTVPAREVRARYSAESITVYQAYPPEIAEPAVAAGRFGPPFKRDRVSWIKPSFLWVMYRCGRGTQPGAERVAAVAITRTRVHAAPGPALLCPFDSGHHRG